MERQKCINKLNFVVPGTGEFQPANTILQLVIKHIIKAVALDFFTACSTRKLWEGLALEDITLPSNLPTLRNASVAWTIKAFRHLEKHPEIVKKAWAKCQTREWDFSWENLTSDAATKLFFATAASNPTFWNEIAVHKPIVPHSKQSSRAVPNTEDEEAKYFGDAGDNPSIGIDELVELLMGSSNCSDIASNETAFEWLGVANHEGIVGDYE